MISNISGLSSALEAVKRKIDLLERDMKQIDVVGGGSILVSRINSKFIINSANDQSGDIQGSYPWYVNVEKLDSTEDVKNFRLRTNGGMINGLLPDNFDDIEEVTDDDELYVYWEAEINGEEITNLSIKTSADKPETQLKMEEEALPTNVIGLVGFFYKGGMKYQFIKNHLDLRPELLLSMIDENEVYKMKNLYSWRWSEN